MEATGIVFLVVLFVIIMTAADIQKKKHYNSFTEVLDGDILSYECQQTGIVIDTQKHTVRIFNKDKVWSTTDGACVGRRAVDEIKEWTEPGNGNQKVVRVSYTWKLVDVPNWIDKKAFASVKGMNEPADGAMNLFKTSNGWKAN
ncbi:TPA: hypothetical protein JKC43_004634 [Salmonella enterica subsp. enterica serovar Enteritidis]|nr:hypothetical protein [Salmonella enterica subsp. enterica serovar Enteritidis]